jgi:hypothetical protein
VGAAQLEMLMEQGDLAQEEWLARCSLPFA